MEGPYHTLPPPQVTFCLYALLRDSGPDGEGSAALDTRRREREGWGEGGSYAVRVKVRMGTRERGEKGKNSRDGGEEKNLKEGEREGGRTEARKKEHKGTKEGAECMKMGEEERKNSHYGGKKKT